MILGLYLLVLAGLMLLINLKAGSRPSKVASYWAMWAAIIASVIVTVQDIA